MAQNFISHRLTTRASKQFRRIATGRTEVVPLLNGSEARNSMWRHKPMRYKANFALMTPEAREEVFAAFCVADAQRLLFRFRDPGDFTVTNSPLAVLAGTKAPVQLTKRYRLGTSYTYDRRIQAIAKAEIVDGLGNPITGTLDSDLGLFTPTANWGATAAWSGRYDVWVRFASDELDVTMETVNISTTDIELVEQLAVKVSDGS